MGINIEHEASLSLYVFHAENRISISSLKIIHSLSFFTKRIYVESDDDKERRVPSILANYDLLLR